MADDFGLGALFTEVKSSLEPTELVIMLQPMASVPAGTPFSLAFKLRNDSGDVPPPAGSVAETQLQAEDILQCGRLAGELPRVKDNAIITTGLKISSPGSYTVETRVTLPDNKVLACKVAIVVCEAVSETTPSPAKEPLRADSESESLELDFNDGASSKSESLGGGERSPSEESLQRAASPPPESEASYHEPPPSPLYSKKAPVTTYSFVHSGKDLDKHGVLYYLGLNKFKAKETAKWVNPMDRGLVEVSASTVRKGELRNFVERRPDPNAPMCLTTEDEEQSWIEVDLKDHVCAPNGYVLANRTDKSRDVLTTWTLEGSMNKKLWVVIDQKKNDLSLSESRIKSGTFFFKTPQCKYYFRHFRVKIGQQGSTSNANILACMCFELYGFFRKRKEEESPDSHGVPLPVEGPVLDSLGLKVHHADKVNTDFKGLVASRFGLTERKRKSRPESKDKDKDKEKGKDRRGRSPDKKRTKT